MLRALALAAGTALTCAAPALAVVPVPAGRYVAMRGDLTVKLQLDAGGRHVIAGGSGTFGGSEIDGYGDCATVAAAYYVQFGRRDRHAFHVRADGRFGFTKRGFTDGDNGVLRVHGSFPSPRLARITFDARFSSEGERCRDAGTVMARIVPRPQRGCRTLAGHTLATSSAGRVFERRGTDDFRDRVPIVYGCLYSTNRPIALDENSDPVTISNVVMAGRYAAYARAECPAGCDLEIASVSLATGDVRRETGGDPVALAVNGRGSLAWSAQDCDVTFDFSCPSGHAVPAIWADGHRGLRELDTGQGVDVSSPNLRGGVATWVDNGVRRSARID